ncbi:MAG: hypothetical protein EP330_00085 [Deltaproteobacteria bacterium]|nr:MAG: hypothetical protein EP330_00085 [Deltaproteobacteria bacterium]
MPSPAERWLIDLRTAYAHSLDAGAAHWKQAHAAVDTGRMPASVLTEAALLALESMADDDPTSLGMSACDALRRHGGADHLERLATVRPRLPARSGLRDWRVDADHAHDAMAARGSGGCTCAAEARHGAAPYGDAWVVEHQQPDPERYCTDYRVRCAACGRHWSVRREDGYHYPIFAWTSA